MIRCLDCEEVEKLANAIRKSADCARARVISKYNVRYITRKYKVQKLSYNRIIINKSVLTDMVNDITIDFFRYLANELDNISGVVGGVDGDQRYY